MIEMLLKSIFLMVVIFSGTSEANLPPKLSPLPDKLLKYSDSKLKLLCLIKQGTEPIQFEWLHNDALIDPNSLHYRIESTQEDSLLIIERISSNDSGYYSCIARNDFGSDRLQTEIIITGLIRSNFMGLEYFFFFSNFEQCVAHYCFKLSSNSPRS